MFPCSETSGKQEGEAQEKAKTFDVTELSKRPLSQSVYAEVLRLYNAIAFTRVSQNQDSNLEGHVIKAGTPMVLLSRPNAMNEEVWTQAGRIPTVPLSEFHAERFLVGSERAKISSPRLAS